MSRDYDIVLYGATGYTGALVADYLARAAQRESFRWAIAGRNRDKLEAMRGGLGDPDVLIAEADDAVALAALAARTKVVCTTAGPYTRYGSALIAACVAAGTHTCDLTGEVTWMRAMIDAHHEQALATGARIVHTCGFDSIPSDLGAWCTQQEYIARFGAPAASVTAHFRMKGGASGGTIATMLLIAAETARDPSLRRVMGKPYGLDPDPSRPHPKVRDLPGLGYDKDLQRFTLPFFMAATNTRVVRRGHALAGFPWGDDFVYREVLTTAGTPGGLASAIGVTAGLAAFALAISSPLRDLLATQLPSPGEGPSRDEREHGFWHVDYIAEGPAGAMVYVAGDHFDPGYGSTARMLGESALCLARDPLTSPGGVQTPSVAMGNHLAERLRSAGLTFAPSAR